jgi:hypothetical protein
MSNGAIIAAMAAAAKQRREEEDMTIYGKDELDGWEFKIVRSNTGRFKDYRRVQELCQEEAKAGWEMLEKFDDYRIRFKRRTERRTSDSHLDIDPYRTKVGMGEGSVAAIIISVIAALILVGILVASMVRHDGFQLNIPVLLPFVLLIVGVVVMIIVRLKR